LRAPANRLQHNSAHYKFVARSSAQGQLCPYRVAYLWVLSSSRFRMTNPLIEKLYFPQTWGVFTYCPCVCWGLEQFRRKVNWGGGSDNVEVKEDSQWANALLKRWKLFLQIKVLMRENRSLHWGWMCDCWGRGRRQVRREVRAGCCVREGHVYPASAPWRRCSVCCAFKVQHILITRGYCACYWTQGLRVQTRPRAIDF
jgi:hypothetical protein